MEVYIGTKIILAEPMPKSQFNSNIKNQDSMPGDDNLEGYHVQYSNPDGSKYNSWSPANVFERAYRIVSDDELEIMLPGPASKDPDPNIGCRLESSCEAPPDE